MGYRTYLIAATAAFLLIGEIHAYQKPFLAYPAIEEPSDV